MDEQLYDVDISRLSADVMIMPLEVGPDGGFYADEQMEMAKDLREREVDAGFYHQADEREWRVLKGELEAVDLVVGFALNFIASGAWAYFEDYLRTTWPRTRLKVKFFTFERDETGTSLAWFSATGAPDDVIAAIKASRGSDQGDDADGG